MERKFIALIGADKFKGEYKRLSKALSEKGHKVSYPVQGNKSILNKLDLISEADEVIFINKGGIITKSMKKCINYAKVINKPFTYLEEPKRAPVVTLCGSGRFKDIFCAEETRLRNEGCIVFTPEIFNRETTIDGSPVLTEETLEQLDRIHNQKIDMSDSVYVINPGGYIGTDTKREIEYAELRGIPVTYFHNENEEEK